MAQVNFRMDDALKAQADAEFRQMGLTFSAAITLLCTQVVLKHRLPFAIEAAGAAAVAPSRELTPSRIHTGNRSSGEHFLAFLKENPIDVPADFKWSRAAASERKMKCLS